MRRSGLVNPEQEEESRIDITPMLDVVFILLIFFIVTATFIKEAGIEVARPDATTTLEKSKASILIAISPNDEIWINRKKVDPRQVRPNIERLKAENPQGTIVVQADKDSTNKILTQILEAAKAAGVKEVAISANPT
ncbi:MAG: biopolymer transporter ExbD [Gammaproteobacteria bacterium]|nr:biopolymer transporter ExbD [Gammaproteobacteria bacterium]NND59829.1 biopolymer transporter ExbD [Gammaproteobacteria bacterium]